MSELDVEKMSIVSDTENLTILRVLDKFCTAAYVAKPEMPPLVILEMLRLTFKTGLSPYSAVAYTAIAFILSFFMEDFVSAKLCADMSLAVIKRCYSPSLEARCLHLLNADVHHISKPLQLSLRSLMDGYMVGMKSGNLDSAFWCVAYFVEHAFFIGQKLATVDEDCCGYINQMKSYKYSITLSYLTVLRQAVASFRGSEIVVDLDVELQAAADKKDDFLQALIRVVQMYTLCYLGDHNQVAEIYMAWGEKSMSIRAGLYSSTEVLFCGGLSCFTMARKSGRKRGQYQKYGLGALSKLKAWVKKGRQNCAAHSEFLEAELYVLRKKKNKAIEAFGKVILLAGRSGILQLQALANERLAEYLLSMHEDDDAKYRLEEALKLYTEWGAMTKVLQLEGKYRDLCENLNAGTKSY